MADVNTHAGNIRLIGGRLCLDFVNTVDSHLKAQPKEYLVDYVALVTWSRRAGAIGAGAAAKLLREAARRPEAAAAALGRAVARRSALYQLFGTIMAGARSSAAQHALVAFNLALAQAPQRSQIIADTHGFSWAWEGRADLLEQPLWQVLWSAADLLTTAEVACIGQCEGENCSWLFLDTSRNRGRRWCSMEDCGNRAKARRYYARSRKR